MERWRQGKWAYELSAAGWLAALFAVGLIWYRISLESPKLLGGTYGNHLCIAALCAVLASVFVLAVAKKMKEKYATIAIFAGSLALKVNYIHYTSCYMRQQDTLLFDYPMGHLGYIGYLFYNHHLPDFDPRTAWSFSHPPLHHIISAVWVKLNTLLGVDIDMSIENIQVLTMFYSMGILFFTLLLLRELGIKGWVKYAVLLFVAFHPSFVLMAGSVNNDVLSAMFLAGTMLYTVRWYRDSSLKNILLLAGMLGLAMMAKLSAGLIAPAVALVFLVRLVQVFREGMRQGGTGFAGGLRFAGLRRLIGRFAAFAAVVFPLGLWYPVRNLIRFGVPLTYAEKLELTDPQYIGDIPLVQRFTDFSLYQLEHLNIQFLEGGNYREFNVFYGLLKTTIFGNFDFNTLNPFLEGTGAALFWINVAVAAAAVAAAVYCLTRGRRHYPVEKGFFTAIFVVYMAGYFKFCVEYPHICTMNVRYIYPVLLLGYLFTALCIQELASGQRREKAAGDGGAAAVHPGRAAEDGSVLSAAAQPGSPAGRLGRVLAAVFLAAAFVWAWLSCLMFLALGVA